MLINCPKCDVSYAIDATVIPEEGRKLRCTNCGEVFLCTPNDLESPTKLIVNEPAEKVLHEGQHLEEAAEEQKETFSEPDQEALAEETSIGESDLGNPSPLEIQDIFQRLSEQNERISQQEKEMSALRKCCIGLRKACGWDSRGMRWSVYFLLLAIILLSLYYSRIQIVRVFPQAKAAYDYLGIQSTIPGEGLVFSNISRREFEDDYVRQMEIKGFIDNKTNHIIKIPELHLEIMDKNAEIIQTLGSKIPAETIAPRGREAFSITVKQPSPLSKYILLTFEPEKNR